MSGQPSPLKSADAAASVQRVLPTPILSVTSSNLPPPRLWKSRFLPPLVANSKLLCMIRVVVEVPEIDVVAEVRGDVEIEQAVAIVVEPDGAVAVHPAAQARRLGDVLKVVAVDVLEQREIAVAIDEQVLAPVVVEVAPDGAHRDAFAGAIEVGESRARGDVLERAVVPVAVEGVRLAEPAVGEVEIGPAVAVEVGDGHRCAECGDVRLDVGDLRVERRPVMHEVNAGRGGFVVQCKPGPRRVR